MKKIFTLFVLLAASTSAFASSPEALKVEGTKLTNQSGKTVALHGVSMGWHSSWPRWYNPDAVAEVVDVWGADVVRAAIGVHSRNGYIARPDEAWQCLTGVVEGAIKNNAYVIIDWHSHAIATDEAVEFFTRAARTWGHHPNVIYEIFNEPVNDSWRDVKSYSRTVIEAIRAIDPDNIILVGSPHWDQDIHLAAADPLTGYDNIMYTMHFYAGTHKDELRARTQAAVDSGLPVFLSECGGMEATGNGPLDYESWDAWVKLMADNDLSWLAWSLSEKDESCSMIATPEVPATGGWRDADLKEWGRLIKHTLENMKTSDIITAADGSELRLNFYGHGSIGFQHSGQTIYVDPVAPYANWASLPKADLILITHDHGDHFDPAAIEALSKPSTVVITDKTMAHGETREISRGASVEALAAYNTSPEKLNFHPRAALHNGYILTLGGTRIYVAGDSEPTPEMLALRDIDVAFLPVNLPYTMTEEQAALAVKAIRPKIFYPYHYGGTDHKTDLEKLAVLIADTPTQMRVRPLE